MTDPSPSRLEFDLNGTHRTVETRCATVVDLLRDELGLTGTKLVCGTGSCGACVVLVDGSTAASCLLPVEEVDGRSVRTIEGVAGTGLHPVQKAFVSHDGLQCGFCTPGFVVEAVAFHDAWRDGHGTDRPPRDEITRALAGHLCRCGAYQNIIAAVQDACEGRFDAADDPPGPRVDARDKVTGAARFTLDVSLPGMLHARLVRSPVAHAELVRLDPSAALAMPGIEAYMPIEPSDGRVRYVDEPLAALAAVDEPTARRAADAVVAHFLELPVVVGIDAALDDDAPNLHGRGWSPESNNEAGPFPTLRRGNLRGPLSAGSWHRYRARRAVDDAEIGVHQSWEFAAQVHTAFEPHCCVADWTDDGLVVHVSTQNVSGLRSRIADRYDLPEERVTVHAEFVGGAFGAKQTLDVETRVAIELSRESGRPVRLAYDRAEELSVGGYRPGARMEVALAGTTAGRIPAIVTTSHADGGVSAGQVNASLHRIAYRGSPRSLLDYDVLTNAPPGRAFRAPCAPQGFASLEGAIDEYAARLQRDPVSLRRTWDASELRTAVYDWVSDRPLWTGRPERSSGRVRRGVGVAFGSWLSFFDARTEVEVRSSADGFTVSNASQDMGNGTKTALAAGVASTFGVAVDEVTVVVGSSSGPWGPASAGSRTTPSVFPAAVAAASLLRDRLVEIAVDDLGLTDARATEGGVAHAGELLPWSEILPRLPPTSVVAPRPDDERRPVLPFAIEGLSVARGLTHAAHVVEVEVDARLGRIRVIRVDGVLAAGRIHVPDLAKSQAYGGVIQGIGYALHEERLLDPVSGLNLTTDLDQYRIPGIAEMPEISIEFIEDGFDHVAGGGVGLAELSTAGVAGAVANAVAAATGHRFTRLPIRPDHVVEALT